MTRSWTSSHILGYYWGCPRIVPPKENTTNMIRISLKRLERDGLNMLARELSNLEKNWLPFGVMPSNASYVPGPGVFTPREGSPTEGVLGRMVYLLASLPGASRTS